MVLHSSASAHSREKAAPLQQARPLVNGAAAPSRCSSLNATAKKIALVTGGVLVTAAVLYVGGAAVSASFAYPQALQAARVFKGALSALPVIGTLLPNATGALVVAEGVKDAGTTLAQLVLGTYTIPPALLVDKVLYPAVTQLPGWLWNQAPKLISEYAIVPALAAAQNYVSMYFEGSKAVLGGVSSLGNQGLQIADQNLIVPLKEYNDLLQTGAKAVGSGSASVASQGATMGERLLVDPALQYGKVAKEGARAVGSAASSVGTASFNQALEVGRSYSAMAHDGASAVGQGTYSVSGQALRAGHKLVVIPSQQYSALFSAGSEAVGSGARSVGSQATARTQAAFLEYVMVPLQEYAAIHLQGTKAVAHGSLSVTKGVIEHGVAYGTMAEEGAAAVAKGAVSVASQGVFAAHDWVFVPASQYKALFLEGVEVEGRACASVARALVDELGAVKLALQAIQQYDALYKEGTKAVTAGSVSVQAQADEVVQRYIAEPLKWYGALFSDGQGAVLKGMDSVHLQAKLLAHKWVALPLKKYVQLLAESADAVAVGGTSVSRSATQLAANEVARFANLYQDGTAQVAKGAVSVTGQAVDAAQTIATGADEYQQLAREGAKAVGLGGTSVGHNLLQVGHEWVVIPAAELSALALQGAAAVGAGGTSLGSQAALMGGRLVEQYAQGSLAVGRGAISVRGQAADVMEKEISQAADKAAALAAQYSLGTQLVGSGAVSVGAKVKDRAVQHLVAPLQTYGALANEGSQVVGLGAHSVSAQGLGVLDKRIMEPAREYSALAAEGGRAVYLGTMQRVDAAKNVTMHVADRAADGISRVYRAGINTTVAVAKTANDVFWSGVDKAYIAKDAVSRTIGEGVDMGVQFYSNSVAPRVNQAANRTVELYGRVRNFDVSAFVGAQIIDLQNKYHRLMG